jgi:hypothetical protein
MPDRSTDRKTTENKSRFNDTNTEEWVALDHTT